MQRLRYVAVVAALVGIVVALGALSLASYRRGITPEAEQHEHGAWMEPHEEAEREGAAVEHEIGEEHEGTAGQEDMGREHAGHEEGHEGHEGHEHEHSGEGAATRMSLP